MVGWFKITIHTKGWAENKDIICKTIKPVVEKLEKTEDIISFFFFEYYDGNKPGRVTLTFYGDEGKVVSELKKFGVKSEIEKWDPAKQSYRFEDNYLLGIRIFEVGSRLALCRINNITPIDKTGRPDPILITLRHAFLQNLGYSSQEEEIYAQSIDPPLTTVSRIFNKIKIK